MMLDYIFPLLILGHFVGDFLLQSRWMGENKSRNVYVLLLHVFIYGFVVTGFCVLGQIINWGYWGYYFSDVPIGIQNLPGLVLFSLIFIPHFVTDFITSKVGGYFYIRYLDSIQKGGKSKMYLYWFWTTIGFDQVVHIICLYWVYSQILINQYYNIIVG